MLSPTEGEKLLRQLRRLFGDPLNLLQVTEGRVRRVESSGEEL